MTAGSYGQSFALKHLAAGRLEDALAEADRAIARDPDDPEPVLDRAQVLHAAGRFDEAAAAVLRAMELDRAARVLDDMIVDDTLWGALLEQARAAADPDQACATLRRYLDVLPEGAHAGELEVWEGRFRGKVETWTKRRPEDD
jgi:tetratricopeptide (TPR) repeat protein